MICEKPWPPKAGCSVEYNLIKNAKREDKDCFTFGKMTENHLGTRTSPEAH